MRRAAFRGGRWRLVLVGYLVGGAAGGLLLVAAVVLLSAVPVRRGIDATIAQAQAAGELVDDGWRQIWNEERPGGR